MMSGTLAVESSLNCVRLALEAARHYRSSSTGFVHFNYSKESHLETIPLYENACYALALLRTKEREKIHEAKKLLERLLPFEVNGDFPLYLHDYPACLSPSHSVNLAVPLQWIVKGYASLTGDLASPLESLLERILERAREKTLSWNARMKYAALQNTFDPNDWHPKSPRDWGDFLTCCTLAGADASKALLVWHPTLALYTGGELWNEKTEPAVSLLDLFMCSHTNLWSGRALSPHPIHLHAALVFPLYREPLGLVDFDQLRLCQIDPPRRPSQFGNGAPRSERFGCASLGPNSPNLTVRGINAPIDLPDAHGHHYSEDPFTLYWGDLKELHSLTLRSHATHVTTACSGNTTTHILTLPESHPAPDALELSLFLDHSEEHDIRVDGAKATLFSLTDTLTITTRDQILKITFELIEGEGIFWGHIFHGNRPNQLALKGENRFATFDWHIALRTGRRSAKATLKMTVDTLPAAPPGPMNRFFLNTKF